MALVGQTAAQFRQQNIDNLFRSIEQLTQMKLAKDQQQIQKDQQELDTVIKPLIDRAGGDIVTAMQLNPTAFVKFYSGRMSPAKAAETVKSIASGNTSAAGMQALLGYEAAAGGSRMYSPDIIKLRDQALTSKDISGLQSYAQSLDPASQEAFNANSLLRTWNPATGAFEAGVTSPDPSQVQQFRGSKPIPDQSLLQDLIQKLGSLFQGQQQQQSQLPQQPIGQQLPGLSQNPYAQYPVYAQGGNPAQLRQYERMTGDVHRPALVGDQEYIMNREAVRQFGPLLDMLNKIAPNPLGGMAPNSVQNMPVKADGGSNSGYKFFTPSTQGGSFPAPGGFIQSEIDPINMPIEQLAQAANRDPSVLMQLSSEKLQELLSVNKLDQDVQKAGQSFLDSFKNLPITELFGPAGNRGSGLPGEQQAAQAMQAQGYGMPQPMAQTPANPGTLPGSQQAYQALQAQGMGTGAIPYNATVQPSPRPEQSAAATAGISRNPYETQRGVATEVKDPEVTGRLPKAEAAVTKINAGEPVSKQEEDALNASASQAKKWISTHRSDVKGYVDNTQIENFLNEFYPEGLSLVDIIGGPVAAEQLRQGREQLELSKESEKRLNKALNESISQFNREMDYKWTSLEQSENLRMLELSMKTNIDAYKETNKNAWERAKTIEARFQNKLLAIAKDLKVPVTDPKVEKEFQNYLAGSAEDLKLLNSSLEILGQASGFPFIQKYNVIPDNERVNLWFRMRRFFNPDSANLGPVNAQGEPITTRLQTYPTGAATGVTPATPATEQPVVGDDLDAMIMNYLSGGSEG